MLLRWTHRRDDTFGPGMCHAGKGSGRPGYPRIATVRLLPKGPYSERCTSSFMKPVYGTTASCPSRMLVLDEADLILSYETKEDFELLSGAVSKRCQRILLTATMSEEMKAMQR